MPRHCIGRPFSHHSVFASRTFSVVASSVFNVEKYGLLADVGIVFTRSQDHSFHQWVIEGCQICDFSIYPKLASRMFNSENISVRIYPLANRSTC